MLDSHYRPDNWGLKPLLFFINDISISSYSFFVLLGLAAGLGFYIFDSGRNRKFNENAIYIVMAALLFGTIGAKIPIWIQNFSIIKSNVTSSPSILLSGRTVVGGVIGGFLGVLLVKKIFKINVKMGNHIAPAAALGIAIGRFGCFLAGCCYGIATGSSWGFDFGDGILRHPTQLYESAFDFGLFFYLLYLKKKVTEPGKLFRVFVTIYFTFRFFIEFVRVEPEWILGMTWYQWATLTMIIFVNRKFILEIIGVSGFKRKVENE